MKSFRVSYISGLQVTGLGNTRTMEIPLRLRKAGLNNLTDYTAPRHQPDRAARDVRNNVNIATVVGAAAEGTMGRVNVGIEHHPKTQAFSESKDDLKLPSHIAVPIPEAYAVTITIQSMVPDSKNFTYHALTNSNTLYTAALSREMNPDGRARGGHN